MMTSLVVLRPATHVDCHGQWWWLSGRERAGCCEPVVKRTVTRSQDFEDARAETKGYLCRPYVNVTGPALEHIDHMCV